MDINLLSSSTIDTTISQAKYNKKAEELKAMTDSLKKVGNQGNVEDDKKLMEMCKEFEQYFIKEMYKSMKSTINYESFIGYSKAESIFSDMLDDEYAKAATENGSLGLAKTLYNQLKQQNNGVMK